MQLPLTEEQTPPPAPRTVTFEQPLSERLRMFLRLEFLYQQATAHRDTPTTWGMRAAIQSLLEILAITSRGDPDRKSTRLNSSHIPLSRMPSSA